MTDDGTIRPGQTFVEAKINDGGHFEKGKWVTLFTPLLEFLVENINIDERKFELSFSGEVPIFKQGVCIGYEKKERSLGLFTQRELMEILEVHP